MFSRIGLAVAATAAAVGWTLTATVPAVVDIGLATGLTGTPGTLTVLECHDVRSSKHNRQMCTGSFVDDATGEEVAVGAFSWAEPGHVYPAQITNGRDRAGFRGVRGALVALPLPSIGLIFIAGMGMALNIRFFTFLTAVALSAVAFVGIAIGIVARLF